MSGYLLDIAIILKILNENNLLGKCKMMKLRKEVKKNEQ